MSELDDTCYRSITCQRAADGSFINWQLHSEKGILAKTHEGCIDRLRIDGFNEPEIVEMVINAQRVAEQSADIHE